MSETVSELVRNLDNVFENMETSGSTDSLIADLSNLSLGQEDTSSSSLGDLSSNLTPLSGESSEFSIKNSSFALFPSKERIDSEFFTENSSNESFDISSSPNAEVASFLSLFNGKYGLNVKSLDSVIPSIDKMLQKNEKIVDISPQNATFVPEQRQNYEKQNKDFEYEIETLRKENSDLKNKLSILESKSSSTDKQNASLSREVKELHQTISSMQELMENQLNDLTKLGEQRMNLVRVVNKQTQLIQNLESVKMAENSKSSNNSSFIFEKPSNYEKQQPKDDSDLYSLFMSVSQVIETCKDKVLLKEIEQIKDLSSQDIQTRLNNIFRSLISSNNSKTEQLEKTQVKEKEASEKNKYLMSRCHDLISVFQEELQFMQTFSRSNDLQLIVNETSSVDDVKSELVRRYCSLTKYVEDTIGKISNEKFKECFTAPQQINPTKIFDLLTAHNIEQEVDEIMERIDIENNIEAAEVFNLLSAQIFINFILKIHIADLHEKVALTQKEIVQNKRKNVELDQSNELKSALNHTQKQLFKIKKVLLNIVPEEKEKESVYDLLKRAVKYLLETRQNVQEEKLKLQAKLRELKDKIEHENEVASVSISSVSTASQDAEEYKRKWKLASKACKKLNEDLSLQQKMNSELKQENVKHIQEKQAIQTELESLKRERQELKNAVQDQLLETEKTKEFVKEARNEKQMINDKLCSELEDKNKEIESLNQKLENSNKKITIMSKKIEENMKIIKTIKKQRKTLGQHIQSLQSANSMLQETVECQRERTQRDAEIAISEYKTKNERLLSEISQIKAQNEELINRGRQLQSEIATSAAARKTSEFKLRSLEERIQLERKSFESQNLTRETASKLAQNNLQQQFKKEMDSIIQKIAYIINNGEFVPETIEETLDRLAKEMNALKGSRTIFMQTIDSVTRAQKMLNVDQPTAISTAVEKLLQENNQLKDQYEELQQTIPKNSKQEEEKQRRAKKQYENALNSLKQWDIWAKRLDGIIHGGDIKTTADSSSLRLSLEECILSSVSNQTIFERINSLRDQKKILGKFDKRLFSVGDTRYTIRNIIILSVAVRRMQKLAGCIPLSPFNPLSEV